MGFGMELGDGIAQLPSHSSAPVDQTSSSTTPTSPLNSEVTPDAPTIDTEQRKTEREIGSEAEISVFTLSNISHNQEYIEVNSSRANRDASDIVKQAFFSYDPGLRTFLMKDAHIS
ncbi:hypothetical protein TNCV_4192781 [Trichonephila clavipes]|nr:hypothetical protein TNCV_4192781 [Trichonephila clavipes]